MDFFFSILKPKCCFICCSIQTQIKFCHIKSTFSPNVWLAYKATSLYLLKPNTHRHTQGSIFVSSHLWSVMFHSSYKSEVEASAKTVLEEDGGTAAVEAAPRDDSHPVTQQVGLVHVVG